MEGKPTPAKSKRSAFFLAMREVLSAITLCVAAVFFFVMAFGFYTYCKWSVPFVLSIASGVACVIPFVFLPERLARIIHYCGGSRTAEKILRWSLRKWQSVVGQSGPGTTGKMASLAQFLIETGQVQEAEHIFANVLQRLSTVGWKLPGRAESSLSFYREFLKAQNRNEDYSGVSAALARLAKQCLVPKIVFVLIPLPVVVYLSATEVLVRAIAVELSQDHTSAMCNYVKVLATGDSYFFGAGTGARVYCDYASSLYESPLHQSTVLSFARSGLAQLNDLQSPYLASKLHTIVGSVKMQQGEDKYAIESLRAAVEFGLLPERYDRYDNNDRERRHVINAMTWLGDLELQQGNLSKSESLYLSAMQRLEKLNESKSDEYLAVLDRFSALQSSRGELAKSAATRKDLCDILESRLLGVVASNMTPDEIEQHRRFTRELEACSVLLKQAGQVKQAAQLASKAEELRIQRVRPLLLNSQQQMEIVDATTRATEHLLSVKYKSIGWQKNLDLLMESEMKSNRARGALDGLSALSLDERQCHVRSENRNRYASYESAQLP